MENSKKKLTWQKPRILYQLSFKRTAAGNPGGGDDYVTFGFSES